MDWTIAKGISTEGELREEMYLLASGSYVLIRPAVGVSRMSEDVDDR